MFKTIPMHKKRFEVLIFSIALMPFCHRVNLNELARASSKIVGGKMIHQLKRFYRLFSNVHFDIDPLWTCYLQELFTVTLCALQEITLILDWSDFKCTKVLRLSLAFMGRSLTLYQKAVPLSKDKELIFDDVELNGKKINSQNQFEAEFLKDFFNHLLSFAHLLSGKHFILVADRGFGYGEFLGFIQTFLEMKAYRKLQKIIVLDYVIRIKADAFVHLQSPIPENISINKNACSKNTKITDQSASLPAGALQIKTKESCFIPNIFYRKDRKLKCNLVIAQQVIIGKTHEESTWRLATSLNNLDDALHHFKKRMQIEEGFKDTKGANNGLQIKNLNFKKLDRTNRFLFCIAVATFCILMIGLHVQRNPNWAMKIATKDRRTRTGFSLSVFALAREAIKNLKEPFYSFNYRKLFILRV